MKKAMNAKSGVQKPVTSATPEADLTQRHHPREDRHTGDRNTLQVHVAQRLGGHRLRPARELVGEQRRVSVNQRIFPSPSKMKNVPMQIRRIDSPVP